MSYPDPQQQQPTPPYPPQQQPAYGQPTQPYAHPQYPEHQPQQQFGQQPAQPQPGGQWNPAAAELQCRICASVPAAKAKFRGHQGMLVIMRFLSLDGPFCRDCGLSTYRTMTSRTLVQGWWGYASFIITPITVLWNFVPRSKVAALPAPRPAAHGQSRRPLDPGPPLLMRPMTIIGLGIPPAIALFIAFLIIANG